jgi:UDP-glucose 4-epimerase
MKVLITGGSGFIGSFLAEKFCTIGEVTVLDNLITGNDKNLSKIKNRIRFVDNDIRDQKIVDSLVNESDLVFHLAASVGVKNILSNPQGTVSINIFGSENILNACTKFNKRVIIASTSEIYGKNKSAKFKESDDRVVGSPQNFRWIYSDSKAIEEAIATHLFVDQGLKVTIARLFNIVGPRQSSAYGMVLPNFVQNALSNSPLIVHGNGEQRRVFCHVLDAVNAFEALNCDTTIGEVFNVGGTSEISIIELAKIVIKLTKSSSNIIFKPYKEIYPNGFEDMQNRAPDLSKIKSFTNWEPKYSMEEVIRDTILYFSE